MTANQIAYQRYVEEQRANIARENEERRSNMSNEQIKTAELVERQRSNIANETETSRSNKAREAETHRSNVANEHETYRSNLARELETHRSNTANESIKMKQLAETVRSNKANESIGYLNARTQATKVANDNLHNIAMESIDREKLQEQQLVNRDNAVQRNKDRNIDIYGKLLNAYSSMYNTGTKAQTDLMTRMFGMISYQ